jgi:hypothetical protein
MRNRTATTLALCAVCGLAAAVSQAQTVTTSILIRQTDPVGPVGNVTSIENLAVNNSGQWIVEVDTDFATSPGDGVLVKNGSPYLREAQSLAAPAGATISSFDSVNLSNTGHSGWNFFLANTGATNNDSGVFFDDALVLQEGAIATAAAFSAATPYIGFFESKINDSNQILVVASIDDPAIATTVDRAMVIFNYDPVSGSHTEAVLAKEGDLLPGLATAVADFGTTPETFAIGSAGDAIFVVLAGANNGVYYTPAGGTPTALAVNGGASPIAGRTWSSLSSAEADLSSAGGHVYTGTLAGDTTTDFLVVKNGQKFIQEGDAPPGIPGGFTLTAFGTIQNVKISGAGDVLWFGDWNDADTTRDTALFLNSTPILQEGVSVVGGLLVKTIASGQDAFSMSPSGRFVIAEVTLDDGGQNRSAAVLIEIGQPCYANCDGSTAAPVLNVADFSCFLNKFASADPYANCDGSTAAPTLNVADFTCFLTKFAAGCS